MSAIQQLLLSIRKRGIAATVALMRQKRAKHARIRRLLASSGGSASLIAAPPRAGIDAEAASHTALMERAEAMLLDDNYFFTFPYQTRGVENPWNYDPIEKKYWPKRRYEETSVHGPETPRDVKIVWEINRFKDLPALGVAAYLTKELRFAEEVKSRIRSWTHDNPFGQTVNWSSPLEIAIRGISWVATLRLLDLAGFDTAKDEDVRRSLWQHAAYLHAALSTDKIVRSNHLIGETAGLYILASLLDFPEAAAFGERAKTIHIEAVMEQTYADGVSRESSGWYHGFVTDFAELVARTASAKGDVLPDTFTDRLANMVVYRNSIFATDGGIVKYGDFDNGRAIALPPEWLGAIFGISACATQQRKNIFTAAQHITAKIGRNYCFVRAGEFGWGGDGFASHAHDDFLAPVVYLDGNPILADAGTYVYNGDPQMRDRFRDARSHSTIIIGSSTGTQKKPGFGWLVTRKPAIVRSYTEEENVFTVKAGYGEWEHEHARTLILSEQGFTMHDDLHLHGDELVEWHFHFHPRWRLVKLSAHSYLIRDFRDHRYQFELSSGQGELDLAHYEYSASYGELSPAQKLILRRTVASGDHRYTFGITRTS